MMNQISEEYLMLLRQGFGSNKLTSLRQSILLGAVSDHMNIRGTPVI